MEAPGQVHNTGIIGVQHSSQVAHLTILIILNIQQLHCCWISIGMTMFVHLSQTRNIPKYHNNFSYLAFSKDNRNCMCSQRLLWKKCDEVNCLTSYVFGKTGASCLHPSPTSVPITPRFVTQNNNPEGASVTDLTHPRDWILSPMDS